MEDMSLLLPQKRVVMDDMSLLRPQKRARQELNIQARMEGASTDERSIVSLPYSLGSEPYNSLSDTTLALGDEELPLADEELPLVDEELPLADEELAYSCKALALSDETLAHSYKARESINSFFLGSPFFPDVKIPMNSLSSNLEPQTHPQLQLQQRLVGLDLQNCYRQILLLSATEVIESLLLGLNHYLEEWKKARGLRPGPSIPSSYSDMVYKHHNSQLSPWFIEAMDYTESSYLLDLEMRGYGPALELKEALRQELTAFLTKAKGQGGRNDVAHPFATSVKQHWKGTPQTPGKVRFLYEAAVGGLTQSQKDYTLRILDLLSNSQNLPECYRDLAQVAFPLQVFFLRDVIEKSKVKMEIVGSQYSLCPS